MFVSYSSLQPTIRRYPMKPLGEECYFSRMDSVHGLICIKDEKARMPLIWNPTTGQLLSLPKPNMSSRYMNTLLGYDPVEGKHKVVCFPHKQACTVCRVFTLGSGQESWRDVRTNLEHMCGYASGRCINEVIYYLAKYCHWYHHTYLMSFDVKSEIFRVIELPSTNIHDDVLMTYEGRLACIVAGGENGLWSLEDADEHEWSSQDFLKPLHKRPFELQGSTQAGEFIYVPFEFRKSSSCIKFYYPVRNSSRRVKLIKGIAGEEFGNAVRAFPNHIESLMPL